MRIQRRGAVIVCASFICALALAFVQCTSLGFLREGAVAGSFPRHISPQFARSLAAGMEAIAPLGSLEMMLAHDDLAAHRLAAAQGHIDRVPAGRDHDALRARLFELRGDETGAVILYLLAGDVAAIEQKIARAQGYGDFASAGRLQRVLIDRLNQDATHRDALSEAWFRMGGLEAAAGYADVAQRKAHWSAALADFERASKLAPLTPKYLLNAGTQALLLGSVHQAGAFFDGVLAVDPANASALAGLGQVALAVHDPQSARHYYDRARAVDANAAGVPALGKMLGG